MYDQNNLFFYIQYPVRPASMHYENAVVKKVKFRPKNQQVSANEQHLKDPCRFFQSLKIPRKYYKKRSYIFWTTWNFCTSRSRCIWP